MSGARANVYGTRLFAEFVSGSVNDNGQMGVRGRRKTKDMLEKDLARSLTEKIDAAHDFGYALGGIVDNDGDLVAKEPVATFEHEIARIPLDILLEPSLHGVFEDYRVRVGANANAVWLPGGCLARTADARVNHAQLGIDSGLGLRDAKVLATAGAIVEKSAMLQALPERLCRPGDAPIGTVRLRPSTNENTREYEGSGLWR